jgi:hypothetical protein
MVVKIVRSTLIQPTTVDRVGDQFRSDASDALDNIRDSIPTTHYYSIRDGNYNVNPNEQLSNVYMKQLSAPRTVNLGIPQSGREVNVKVDGSVSATSYITVQDTTRKSNIDSAKTYIINYPNSSASFWSDGSQWFIGSIISNPRGTRLLDNSLTPGGSIVAAATIAPTSAIHLITGTTSITTITPPNALWSGELTLITQSALTFGTGGNISRSAATVANQSIRLVYLSGTALWYL